MSGLTCVLATLLAILFTSCEASVFDPDYKSFTEFSPCHPSHHIDGDLYYHDLAKGLEAAQAEIIIVGWKLHPEVNLTGRGEGKEKSLLSYVSDAVQRGVKVYVLYWQNDALYALGKDWMGMRVKEGIAQFESVGASALVDKGRGWEPTFRWSQHQKTVVIDRNHGFVGGIDVALGRGDGQAHVLFDDNRIEPQWDDWSDLEEYKPWHDITVSAYGEGLAAGVAGNAVQRWNSYCDQLVISNPNGCKADNRPPSHLSTVPRVEVEDAKEECQITRTAGFWNTGLAKGQEEESILESYMQSVRESKYFVYIEQQYFSSNPGAENKFAETLFERIKKALLERSPFHVAVLLPIQPEEKHLIWPTQQTVLLDHEALVPRCERLLADLRIDSSLTEEEREFYAKTTVEDYLTFYFLGTHSVDRASRSAKFMGVFVHAKGMIVDDRITLIGSANGNDRSFLHPRDSEINMVTRPKVLIDSTMNGEAFQVSEFARDLRMSLWQEHLGDEVVDIRDPVATLKSVFLPKALEYNKVVLDVFNWDPTKLLLDVDYDRMFSYTDTYSAQGLTDEQLDALESIKGHLMYYPPNTWGSDKDKIEDVFNNLPFIGPAMRGEESNDMVDRTKTVYLVAAIGGGVLAVLAVLAVAFVARRRVVARERVNPALERLISQSSV